MLFELERFAAALAGMYRRWRAVLAMALALSVVPLLPVGLAGSLGVTVPGWSPLGVARADDDDDDDSDGGSAGDPGPQVRQPDAVAFEVIAIDLAPAQLAVLDQFGYQLVDRQRMASLGFELFRLREPPLLRRFGLPEALERAGLVERLHPNHRYRLASSACADGRCYGAELLGWPVAVSASRCGDGARVGVIDTAVDRRHPALARAKIESRAFNGGSSGTDHGTAVAALLVGEPTSAHPGLVPGATLYAADVFERDLLGQPRTDAHAVVRALDWLSEERVRAINLSFAGPANEVLREAVRRTAGGNRMIAAAAGNDGPTASPVYPAAWGEVVAVTAVDSALRAYRRANRGDYVEIAAPGVAIWTARSGREGRFDSGTSFATVFVTAALVGLDPGGKLRAADLRARLAREARDLGTQGRDPMFGHGLLQTRLRCAPARR
jgi:hypothetical protein